MAKPITWVGIDDDKMNLTVAVLRGARQEEPEVRRVPNEDRGLRRWVRRLVREAASSGSGAARVPRGRCSSPSCQRGS